MAIKKAFSQPLNIDKYDVLILGAGISGLVAAYTLKRKAPNLKVAVIEGRDRIGGRIFTAKLGKGLVSEYGAEWIGATHKILRGLCRTLGIELESHRYSDCPPYLQKRKHKADPTIVTALEKLEKVFHRWPSIRGKNFKKLDHISIRKLVAKDCTPEEINVLNELYSGEFGEDIRYVSAVRAVADHLSGGKNSHMDFHIRGGNEKLTDALAKAIGLKNIFLNKEVVKIAQNKKLASVLCHDGTVLNGKKIICTLPMPVIARTKFSPPMESDMKKVAKKLHYGNIVKIILLFPKRFWLAENYSQLSSGITQYVYHTTQNQRGQSGALCIYATGKKADELTHMSMNQIWDLLRTTFPEYMDIANLRPTKMFRHSWVHDRFSGGAYAVYHPDEWAEIQEYYSKPYNHIHFAGEYLADLQGFMEGAAVTGMAAAKSVLKELRKMARQ